MKIKKWLIPIAIDFVLLAIAVGVFVYAPRRVPHGGGLSVEIIPAEGISHSHATTDMPNHEQITGEHFHATYRHVLNADGSSDITPLDIEHLHKTSTRGIPSGDVSPIDVSVIEADLNILVGCVIGAPYRMPPFPHKRFVPSPVPLLSLLMPLSVSLPPPPIPVSIWVSDLVSVPMEIPSPGKKPMMRPAPSWNKWQRQYGVSHNDVIIIELDKIIMPSVKRVEKYDELP